MPARKAVDLCQRFVYFLGIKRTSSLKEGILVTEITMMGAASRYYDGIRDHVSGTPDQIPADRWNAGDIPFFIPINFFRSFLLKVLEKLRLFILHWADIIAIRMMYCYFC